MGAKTIKPPRQTVSSYASTRLMVYVVPWNKSIGTFASDVVFSLVRKLFVIPLGILWDCRGL